ncbi:hypothetical protein [Rhodospirillum rubrum]|uniref:hypothetical protein n=1 Tax=Rhodospirillum rubrum TaxID=1085 RepID=UPI001F5BF77D|nr:hypothetical protein [Rhodospirillum rubrum]
MASRILSFGRAHRAEKTVKVEGWTNQQLAELYRITDLLGRSGMSVATDMGLSDEGEPWFVFYDPESGDVIAHFARIDGLFVVVASAAGTTLRGRDFRHLIDQIVESQPLVFPKPERPGNVRKLHLHPSIVLTAFIATALLHSRKALADGGHDGDGDHKSDGRGRGSEGSGQATDAGHQGGGSGFLFQATSMASALAFAMVAAQSDPSFLEKIGLSEDRAPDLAHSLAEKTAAPAAPPSQDPTHHEITPLAQINDQKTGFDGSDDLDGQANAPLKTEALKTVLAHNDAQTDHPVPSHGVPVSTEIQTVSLERTETFQNHPMMTLSELAALEQTPIPGEPHPGAPQSAVAQTVEAAVTSTATPARADASAAQTASVAVVASGVTERVSSTTGTTSLADAAEAKDLALLKLTFLKSPSDSDGLTTGGSAGTTTADSGLTVPETSLTPASESASHSVTIDGPLTTLSASLTEVVQYTGGHIALTGYQVGTDSIVVADTINVTNAQISETTDGDILLSFGVDSSIKLIGIGFDDLAALV